MGDWLNPSGELDTFTRAPGVNTTLTPAATGVGPPVASFLGTLGFSGFDEGVGTDYAFTQVPLPPPDATTGSFVFVSGVIVVLHSQNVLLTLIGADPPRFRVPGVGSNTFTRYFGVGDGSPSNAVDLENQVGAATANVDFALPATGSLRVNASDESGAPIPARVTVVGFDPSPEPTVAGPSLPGFGSSRQGVLHDTSDVLPYGIAAVGHTGASGTTELPLEPGASRYHVTVSRGTGYSAFRTAAPISISPGSTTVVNAQIARVVDTSGFVSSEFHVHGLRSADSRVSDVHRVQAYASEGVENVIMTDHHVHTNLQPAIDAAGLGQVLRATIGEEITSFDYGHFNAYPLRIDWQSPHATYTPDGQEVISGGSTDWAQAALPGRDFPAYGALNATPAQVLALATAGALSEPETTIQINHIDSHFAPLKIDTSLVPPQDLMTDLERANRRLPATGSVPNLFQHFPALELWNGDNRNDQRQFLEERIGIWFNLDVTRTPAIGGVPGADRLSASVYVPFDGLTSATWFVVVVRGSDGQCGPMFPVYPDDLDPASNKTLSQLADGNVGQGGVVALGATNALYFEP